MRRAEPQLQTHHPRRGRLHDVGRAERVAPHDGGLHLEHALLHPVQLREQDHRSNRLALCEIPLPANVQGGNDVEAFLRFENGGLRPSSRRGSGAAAGVGGDLRRAITLLQNTYMLHGEGMKGEHITDAAAVIPDEVMQDLVASCRSNSFEKMQGKINDLIADGYPANQVTAPQGLRAPPHMCLFSELDPCPFRCLPRL